MLKAIRRQIVRAAPTCTLWIADTNADVLRFKFYRGLFVTVQESAEIG